MGRLGKYGRAAPAVLAIFAAGCHCAFDPDSARLPGTFEYVPDSGTYFVGQSVQIVPSTEGVPLTYALDSGYLLPVGLRLDGDSGVISGTPAALSPERTYGVTATNARGSTSNALVTIKVIAGDVVSVGRLAAGGDHTCAVVNDGAFCWGGNTYGQLGNDSDGDSPVPVAVTGLAAGIQAIAAGAYHTCAVVNGGALCWGYNFKGQLGNGFNDGGPRPVAVTGLAAGVQAIAAGRLHTCAIVDGGVLCWGDDTYGQLGSDAGDSWTPVPVTGLTAGVQDLAAGNYHTCAVAGGGVKCWGYNDYGQLGNGSTGSIVRTPDQVSGLTTGVQAIAAGSNHTCAVVGGAAKCWGQNAAGQLGNSSTGGSNVLPSQVWGLTAGVQAIAAGNNHTCAVAGGGVKCWGSNDAGQLGNDTTADSSRPVQVSGLDSGIQVIAAGSDHTCAVAGGGVQCWGANDAGQLGNNTRESSPVPVQVYFH